MASSHLLHFDLSAGCAARALCASLIDLGASLKTLQQAFVQVGLQKLTPQYTDKTLDLADETGRSIFTASSDLRLANSRAVAGQAKLRWHHTPKPISQTKPKDLGEQAISLRSLDPIPAALAQKAKTFLEEAGLAPTESDLCEIISFCILLADLDPGAVSASRIPLSFDPTHSNHTALLKLTASLPVYEQEWPAPSCDALSLALLKACGAHFGARGESQLVRLGLAFNPEVKALWCEKSPFASPKVAPLVEISAQITNHHLISELTHRLGQIGAKKIWTQQILAGGNLPTTLFTAIASEADQNKTIEALLIMGQTSEVQVHVIEQHSLHQRTVSVSLGRPQKPMVCRVVEYLWSDRILRADPLAEDLEALTKSSGNPQEIIRADVLSAWKKRGL